MLQSVNLGHFRPRKALEVTVPPPTAPRPPHTLCGHRRRRDTFPRGSAERSAPPQLSGERRGAASGSFGESPTSCTAYRGEFSAPEAFVPHAARRDEVRAGAPRRQLPKAPQALRFKCAGCRFLHSITFKRLDAFHFFTFQ